MKTKFPVFQTFFPVCLCAFVCQAWTVQIAENNSAFNAKSPEAILCGVTSSTSSGSLYKYIVSVSQLTIMDSICMQSSSENQPRIIRFNMTTIPVKGYMEQVNCYTNHFDKVVKELIVKLGSGDMVLFDDIRAMDSQGRELKLLPISILVR